MSAPPSEEARAFESALRANPHDLAGWCAYADWLTEQGDPRGEFMQVQLALEDETRSKSERAALKEREAEFLKAHEREWLGEELGEFLLANRDEPDRYDPINPVYEWRRGFLWELVIGELDADTAQALAHTPAARMLQALRVHGVGEHRPIAPGAPNPPGVDRYSPLFELIGSPLLDNLRVFQYGPEVADESLTGDQWQNMARFDCWTYHPGLEHVIGSMSRVEELHLFCKQYDIGAVFGAMSLPNLRVLRVYHLGTRDSRSEREGYAYPLGILAANPAMSNLTHLLFHPHHEEYSSASYPDLDCFLPLSALQALTGSPHLTKLTHLQFRLSNMGDEGAREIVRSGLLKRLKWLDLRHGCVTDEGARALAECPDLRNLGHLDLSRNMVTDVGLNLLKQTGTNVRADYPLTDAEIEEQVYLFEGDSE
ncbi:MAG TPA: TIGR02996 domain-containing protein [Gemmata sp.]